MNPKNTIKIIKRGKRDNKFAAEPSQNSESQRKSTREVVATWVKEFQQQRRHVEPRRSFASLFNGAVDPSLASS